MATHDLQTFLESLRLLGPAMERMKRDRIANSLMNRTQPSGLRALPADGSADPGIGDAEDQSAPVYGTNHTGGFDEFQMQQAQDKTDINKLLREAQLTRALQGPATRATAGTRATGYQPPPDDAPEGTIWNGHDRFVRDPSYVRANGQRPTTDTYAKLNQEVKAATGVELGAWNTAKNQRIENGMFKAEIGPSTVSVPQATYQQFLARLNKLQGNAPAGTAPAPQEGASQPALDGVDDAPAVADDPYAKARDAISRGADADAVKKRLAAAGLDPSRL